jgi:TPP-dependent pyruvate/acetoin dehydrogenase alpha subunit
MDRFRLLCRLQALDEQLQRWRSSGRVAFSLPLLGDAAVSLTPRALAPGDWCFPTARQFAGAMLARGGTWPQLLGQLLGSQWDPCKGRPLPLHGVAPALGVYGGGSSGTAHLLQAVGAAWALAQEPQGRVVLALLGPTAAQSGAFLQALQLAVAWRAPILFVARVAVAPSFATLAGVAPCQLVDGQGVDAVLDAVREARQRVVASGGPVLVAAAGEADGAGDDPVGHYGELLAAQGAASARELATMANEERAELRAAVHEAEAVVPWPAASVGEGVWGDPTLEPPAHPRGSLAAREQT